MGSYKKIGLSHEMGLIDTPPLLSSFLWYAFMMAMKYIVRVNILKVNDQI